MEFELIAPMQTISWSTWLLIDANAAHVIANWISLIYATVTVNAGVEIVALVGCAGVGNCSLITASKVTLVPSCRC